MNIRLDHGAVHPDLATFLYSLVGGRTENDTIDFFQRLGSYLLDVSLQRFLGRDQFSDTKTAERAVVSRVFQVVLEQPVTEAIHLLDEQDLENLLGTHHPFPSRAGVSKVSD